MSDVTIEGQLQPQERQLLRQAILQAPRKPQVVLEVGTWLGGGSTLHLLRALEENGAGHLWGIEADPTIYERMLANLRAAAPEALHRFTPLFGFSQQVIPRWLSEQGPGFQVDVAFLDGGDNPLEQVQEFQLLDPVMPVGAQLLAHDAKLRKGRWLGPYIAMFDNWESRLHDISDEGLLYARKIAPHPSPASLRAARWKLFKMRLDPVEIAGALMPRQLCKWILDRLPERLSKRIAQGRK